jgi:hypothetical protein
MRSSATNLLQRHSEDGGIRLSMVKIGIRMMRIDRMRRSEHHDVEPQRSELVELEQSDAAVMSEIIATQPPMQPATQRSELVELEQSDAAVMSEISATQPPVPPALPPRQVMQPTLKQPTPRTSTAVAPTSQALSASPSPPPTRADTSSTPATPGATGAPREWPSQASLHAAAEPPLQPPGRKGVDWEAVRRMYLAAPLMSPEAVQRKNLTLYNPVAHTSPIQATRVEKRAAKRGMTATGLLPVCVYFLHRQSKPRR